MKKLFLFYIVVFISMVFSGCDKKDDNKTSETINIIKKNLTKEECKSEQEKIFADMWNKKIDKETGNKLMKENYKICCKYSAFKKGCNQ